MVDCVTHGRSYAQRRHRGPLALQGFFKVWLARDFPGSCVIGLWVDPQLWLATQCLRWLLLKGPYEKRGLGLACGFEKRPLQRMEYGARLYLMVCTQLWTQWHVRAGTLL
jgi:hypothetical protein